MSENKHGAGERKGFVGGNWKMTGSRKSVEVLVAGLNKGSIPENVDVVVAPVALHIESVQKSIRSPYQVSAQNCSQFNDGAYTGELSAGQIKDFGLNWVILGHSERRKYFNESDKVVADKVKAALAAGLSVIACLGETLEERKGGQTLEVVHRQLEAIAGAVGSGLWPRVVLAYEPVWAIGTGVVATPEQAQEVHAALRGALGKISKEVAAATRIIYGGSVKADNCGTLRQQPDIDGFLVGGASLVAEDFVKICNAKPIGSSL